MSAEQKRNRRYLRSRITRRLILDTAQSVFLEEGYAKTTITKISQQANVGYGTVYSHFKGKNDLLNKVIDQVMENFIALLNEPYSIENSNDLGYFFRKQMQAAFELATIHRPILKVLKESLGQSETIFQHWKEVQELFIERASKYIATSQQKGLSQPINPQMAAKSIILLIESLFWEVVHEKEDDLELLTNTVIELLFNGLSVEKSATSFN